MSELRIQGILESCLYVDDLDAAEVFYRDVLKLSFYSSEPGKFVFFRAGQGMLLIFDPEASGGGAHDLPNHSAEGILHVAFAVEEASLDGWRQHLEAEGVAIEQDHLWPHGKRSLYFRDPAGHSLELASTHLWTEPT